MKKLLEALATLLPDLGESKISFSRNSKGEMVQNTPTPKPRPTAVPPSPTATPTPTPTPKWDISRPLSRNQMANLVNQYFSQEAEARRNELINTFMGESSGRIGAYHINKPNRPTGLPGDGGEITPQTTQDWWVQQRRDWPSIDVGLTQLSTAGAMNDYLAQKGYTYWDLLHDPDKNMQVASDLYYGRIPRTAPGLGNWVAAKLQGYVE